MALISGRRALTYKHDIYLAGLTLCLLLKSEAAYARLASGAKQVLLAERAPLPDTKVVPDYAGPLPEMRHLGWAPDGKVTEDNAWAAFLTLEKTAMGVEDIRLIVSAHPRLRWNDRRNRYRFRLELGEEGRTLITSMADSTACPRTASVVRRLRAIGVPPPYLAVPPIPGRDAGYAINVTNAAAYRLEVAARFDGVLGNYAIESGGRSPLAAWAERLFRALQPCWSRRGR